MAGRPLLDLTGSNPSEAGLGLPAAPLLEALASPGNLAYQPEPRGLPEARQAIAQRQPSMGLGRLFLTASTSEAYSFLFKLLADPGDAVLVPAPSYPLFEYLAGLEGLSLARYRLLYDGRWQLDRDSVRQLAAEPGVRAIVALHPNNPTGSYLARSELEFLGDLCAERGLALISDEVFFDYALTSDPERAPSAVAQDRCLTFSLSGLSKIAGLPQLKLGWIAAAGSEPALSLALSRLEVVADSYLSVSSPVQHALPRLLGLIGPFQESVRQRLRQNLSVARAALAPPAPASLLHVDGGWSLPLRLPATQSGEAWALELLERESVLVQPGYFYDFEGEAYLVVSLLTPEPTFAEGMMRIRRALLGQTPAR
ncbi:MAG: pyridoxal phosphate-dependent aminotransferase [Myxococcales bacterium]